MGLSYFPEFNQSITLSILCYLPPNLPPYDVGKLGNKTPIPLQNIVAEIGVGLLQLDKLVKVGEFFKVF
jgi:hypothetical protein